MSQSDIVGIDKSRVIFQMRLNTDSTFLLDLTIVVLAIRGDSLSIHSRYSIHRGLKPRLYLNCGGCPQSAASDPGVTLGLFLWTSARVII